MGGPLPWVMIAAALLTILIWPRLYRPRAGTCSVCPSEAFHRAPRRQVFFFHRMPMMCCHHYHLVARSRCRKAGPEC